MIDLDEELSRMEAMLARREVMALGVTCKEMIELIARLRQAEKDAARYRWLRGMRGGPLVVSCDIAGVPEVDKDGDLNFIWGDGLDTEIDEAMNGSNN